MAQSGVKKRGLPPIQKGPTMMAPAPTIPAFDDDAKEKLSTFEEQALVIDTNLLVGPVYDNSKQRAKALKEQLGDINTRLQTTLTSFDTVNPFGQDEEMLGDLDKHVAGMESGQMKATLKHFLNNYRDMSSHITDSSKEREDILFQLSDWFTLDHLDDLEAPPVTQEEEAQADKNYSDALVNFEKFKRLQSQIKTATDKGLNVDHLMQEKKRLERDVMGGFRHLKKGKETKQSGGDSTWRHAADEVVSMLRKVRAENADELEILKTKVNGLVLELQQKSESVDKLRKDLREKKSMMQRFADDNADLTDDVAKLRFKIKRLEVDMENATKLLEKQIDLSALQLPKQEEGGTGKEITVTLSFIIRQLGEATDANNLKRLTSDPAILRKQIRESRETIEAFSRELIKLNQRVKNLEEACRRKDVILMDLETVNNQLREKMGDSRSDMSLSSLRQSAMSVTGLKVTLSSHMCNHCKCHMTSRSSLMARSSSQETRPKADTEKIDKLYRKLDSFRKALADAEMKLSQTYREMAEMRRRSLAADMSGTDLAKIESESSDEEDKTFKFEGPHSMKEKKKIVKEPKRAKKNIRRKSIKPKAKKEKPLPPIAQPQIPEPEEPPLPELEDDRENTLWKVGDIQGRLNMLISAIMSFVTDIGKMIDKDEDEEPGKQPTMQQFQFGQSYEEKAMKNAMNQRMSEGKQKRGQVILSGQRAVAILREAYDLLSASLNLGHDDYENIYRAFKKHQQIRAVHHAALMGRMPGGSNVVRMGSSENAVEYYQKSYGGSGGATIGGRSAMANQPWDLMSSRVGNRPASETSSKGSLHSSTGIRIEDAVMVQSIKRSKSDLQLHDEGMRMTSMGLGGGQRAPVFMMGSHEPRMEVVGGNKEEVMLPTATIPKKGLIKLTALDQELADPELFSNKKVDTGVKSERRKSEQQKTILIKRKDIRDQIREGTRLLEEEEQRKQQEEQRKQQEEEAPKIEDYTLGDLQSALGFVSDDLESKRENIVQSVSKQEAQAQSKTPKMPKIPQVIESIKQQTFQFKK